MNDILTRFAEGNWRPSDIDALFAEVLRLRRENAGLKAFALNLAERICACSDILSHLAERKIKRP